MTTTTKKGEPVTLTIEATKRVNAMYLREQYAAADVEHGGETFKVEYCVGTSGAPLVSIEKAGGGEWVVYSISTENIMRAVCDAHFDEVPS